jgi:GT2 family glycosyltransferase
LPLSIVIPSLNTKAHLENMLSSLAEHAPREPVEVVVVDMTSTDGTMEMLKSRFPKVKVLEDAPNKGYGAAANAGLARATGSHIFIGNTDLLFQEGTLDRILGLLRQFGDQTLLGFRLEGLDGKLQDSAFRLPGRFDLTWRFSAVARLWPRLNNRLTGHLDELAISQATKVGWVTGAALAASSELFRRVGGFDETFFMYSEEVDLCRRINDLGGAVVYAPEVLMLHVGGASLSDDYQRFRWLAAGKVRYTRKHYGGAVLLAARLGAAVAYLSSFPVWIASWMLRRISWRWVRVWAKQYGLALVEAWRT